MTKLIILPKKSYGINNDECSEENLKKVPYKVSERHEEWFVSLEDDIEKLQVGRLYL